MRRRLQNWHGLLLLFAVCLGGCYSPYIRTPNFAHPGTAGEQRAAAERFDPYPDPDAGPEVVGGRPPGFTRPLTDTEWGRRFVPPPGGVPPPVTTIPTAPVVVNPFSSTAPTASQPIPPPMAPSPAASPRVQTRAPY